MLKFQNIGQFSYKFSSLAKPKVALFPGQGTQKLGMLGSLVGEPWAMPYLKEFNDILGFNIEEMTQKGPKNQLDLTENAQPAIFISSFLRYLKDQHSQNIQICVGNSVGEITALCFAGSIKYQDVLKILQKRGQLMQRACLGKDCGMLAVQASLAQVEKEYYDFCSVSQNKVELAVINSPRQIVFTGESTGLQEFSKELRKKRIFSVFLKVSAAFHCQILSTVQEEYRDYLKSFEIKPPRLKVIRNLDLKIYEQKQDIVEGLTEILTHPVQFEKTITHLKEVESIALEDYIEYGNTQFLIQFAKDIYLK